MGEGFGGSSVVVLTFLPSAFRATMMHRFEVDNIAIIALCDQLARGVKAISPQNSQIAGRCRGENHRLTEIKAIRQRRSHVYSRCAATVRHRRRDTFGNRNAIQALLTERAHSGGSERGIQMHNDRSRHARAIAIAKAADSRLQRTIVAALAATMAAACLYGLMTFAF